MSEPTYEQLLENPVASDSLDYAEYRAARLEAAREKVEAAGGLKLAEYIEIFGGWDCFEVSGK